MADDGCGPKAPTLRSSTLSMAVEQPASQPYIHHTVHKGPKNNAHRPITDIHNGPDWTEMDLEDLKAAFAEAGRVRASDRNQYQATIYSRCAAVRAPAPDVAK